MSQETLQTLPLSWIEKIFTRLRVVYGPALLAGVLGTQDKEIMEVMQGWAEELRNFKDHPGAIKYALNNLPADYPPNLLAFKAICREGLKFEEKPLTLERKMTHEEIEFGRVKAENLVKQVKQPSNHRKWIYALRERINQGQSVSVEVERILREAELIESIG